MKKRMLLGTLCTLIAGGMVTAHPGAVRAALKTRYLHMDQFKQTFQPLTSDTYARYYPSVLGGRRLPSPPIRNYGGCTVLKFPNGAKLREITYVTNGDSGWSMAFIQRHRYGEIGPTMASQSLNYPGDTGENTLLALTDEPIRILKGWRYYLCVEGAPGTNSGDYNQFLGFKIRYAKP